MQRGQEEIERELFYTHRMGVRFLREFADGHHEEEHVFCLGA